MLIIEDDMDVHELVLGALNYGFGRMTMYPSFITSFIKKNWDTLPENTKERILHFTKTEIKLNDSMGEGKYGHWHLGMDCDVKMWKEFLEWLKAQPSTLLR